MVFRADCNGAGCTDSRERRAMGQVTYSSSSEGREAASQRVVTVTVTTVTRDGTEIQKSSQSRNERDHTAGLEGRVDI